MNSNEAQFERFYVDGQLILFPKKETWNILRANPILDKMPLSVLDLLWPVQEFVQQYHKLHLGIGRPSKTSNNWLPYVFLETDSGLQRVHLETLRCGFCTWQGKTANPMVMDVYIGEGVTHEYFKLMKAAEKHPVLPCPKCGKPLPRHPIWVEPLYE